MLTWLTPPLLPLPARAQSLRCSRASSSACSRTSSSHAGERGGGGLGLGAARLWGEWVGGDLAGLVHQCIPGLLAHQHVIIIISSSSSSSAAAAITSSSSSAAAAIHHHQRQ